MTDIGHVTDPLRDIGLKIEGLLTPLQRANTSVEKCAAIFHECERFRLWAWNLGLCATGHASLFYRLREADTVRTVIESLLQDFKSMLVEVSRRLNIELPADELFAIAPELLEGPLDMEDECGDDYANEDEDEVQLCIQEAADILDRLFRIASKIRSPATRTVSSKALKFQLPDSETGVDLFDQYTKFDQGHVQETFRHNGIDLHAINVTYLVDRMSRAITTRRRILAHGKRHRSKVAYAAQANQTQPKVGPRQNKQEGVTHPARLAVSAAGLSNPTTATLLDPNKAILDAKSNVSESVYAPTARGTDNDAVEVPPPPDIGNDRYFECPYCFFLCSKEYTRDKSWRNHVLHDLRPYACTYPNCVEGDILFDSRQDWINHENSSHRSIWRCIHHVNQTFEDAISYRQHLEKHHEMANEDPSIEALVRAGVSSLTQCDRPCPFCHTEYENINDMHLHVAYHLERFSIFALPRSHHLEKGEDTDDGKAASNDALQNESLGGEDSTEKSSLAFESQPSRTESLAAHSVTAEEPRIDTQQQEGVPAAIRRVASHFDPNASIRLQPSPTYYPPLLGAYSSGQRGSPMAGIEEAASVIAVVQTTAQVASLCGVYLSGVKDAQKDVQRLYLRITSLQGVLEKAKQMVVDSKSAKLLVSDSVHQSLKQCLTDLEDLKTKLDTGKRQKAMKRIGLRALKWPFTRKEVDQTVQMLEGYTTTFSVALQADQISTTLAADDQRESPAAEDQGASPVAEVDFGEENEYFVQDIAIFLHEHGTLFMRARLDTGTEDNAISKEKALETGFEIEPYTGPDIIIGNGDSFRPVGYIDLRFYFLKIQTHKSWNLRFLIPPNDPPFDVALGRNFILSAKLFVRPNEALPMEYKRLSDIPAAEDQRASPVAEVDSREEYEYFVEDIAIPLHKHRTLFMQATLDTGMEDNAISEEKALETGFEIEPYTGPDMTVENGGSFLPVGYIDLRFYFLKVQAGKSWNLRFMIIPNNPPFDVALGRNFILSAKLLVRPNEALPMEYKRLSDIGDEDEIFVGQKRVV